MFVSVIEVSPCFFSCLNAANAFIGIKLFKYGRPSNMASLLLFVLNAASDFIENLTASFSSYLRILECEYLDLAVPG